MMIEAGVPFNAILHFPSYIQFLSRIRVSDDHFFKKFFADGLEFISPHSLFEWKYFLVLSFITLGNLCIGFWRKAGVHLP